MPDTESPLARAARRELARFPPFDALEADEIAFLAARLSLAYHARGGLVVAPGSGVADRLRIVRRGSVRGGLDSPPSPAEPVLGPGECFPLDALVGRRASAEAYLALEDTFCWELPAQAFHELLGRSPRFRAWCTDQMAALVARAREARRAEASTLLSESVDLLAPLAGLVSRAAVSCAPDESIAGALRAMRSERVGSIVVCDAQGAPAGIFTTTDLLTRVVTEGVSLDAPVDSVATAAPFALEAEAPVIDALLAMARHGFRHVVITRGGRLAGVVSERDLFALQRHSVGRVSQRLQAAQSVPELAQAAAGIRDLSRHLLAQGVDAEHLTAMTSALNDGLARRLIGIVAPRHGLPARWCWLALGSEGRMEQTLATDQDNALVFEAAEAGAARNALLAFADDVNRGLADCGFPLCRGDIMARNPRWCLTLAEWRARFDDWIRNPLPEALLNAAIFFDFRPLAGDAALAGRLRAEVLDRARGNEAFQRALAENALRARAPLGLLRDLMPEEGGAHPGTLDLKGNGARLLVDAARVLALSRALPATGTAARLRAAAQAGALPPAEADAAVDAFHHIQDLRLRRQYLQRDIAPGSENRIDPARLNEVDRRVLRAAFRQAALLQDRLRADYAL